MWSWSWYASYLTDMIFFPIYVLAPNQISLIVFLTYSTLNIKHKYSFYSIKSQFVFEIGSFLILEGVIFYHGCAISE